MDSNSLVNDYGFIPSPQWIEVGSFIAGLGEQAAIPRHQLPEGYVVCVLRFVGAEDVLERLGYDLVHGKSDIMYMGFSGKLGVESGERLYNMRTNHQPLNRTIKAGCTVICNDGHGTVEVGWRCVRTQQEARDLLDELKSAFYRDHGQLPPWNGGHAAGLREEVVIPPPSRRPGASNLPDVGVPEQEVQDHIVRFLREDGWDIVRECNIENHDRGVDILARKDGKNLAVEVKGYPSIFYVRGPKKDQPKPTNPRLQSKHWFANALCTIILRKAEIPDALVALGFPEAPVYLDLTRKIWPSLCKLDVTVYFVKADGSVYEYGSEDA